MAREISRRNFLRRFPALFGGADAIADALEEAAGSAKPDPVLPEPDSVLEGIPVVHPWMAAAYAVAEQLGRRRPYVLLVGASGEAFHVGWEREDPLRAMREGPVNTFLAALAVAGLSARATTGGPFEPAIGGVEVAARKGLTAVLATDTGPEVVVSVDRDGGKVLLAAPGGGLRRVPFAEFEPRWAAGRWMNGPAPFLRVTVEAGSATPRPLDDIAKVGIETAIALLSREDSGLAAYDRLIEDLGSDDPPEEGVLAEWLQLLAAGRLAAGRFLTAIARAMPPDVRSEVARAAASYDAIEELGFEVTPGRLEAIRAHEAKALEALQALPPTYRHL